MFHNKYKKPAAKLVAGFLSRTAIVVALRILQQPVMQIH